MNFVLTIGDRYTDSYGLSRTEFGPYTFYHDEGWIFTNNTAYKGTHNNFCELVFADHSATLNYNEQRDFPLWYDDNICTNIFELKTYLPADAVLKHDKGWHVTYNDGSWKQDSSIKISDSEAYQLVKKVLIENVTRFAEKNTVPIVAPDSDGIDTLLVRSVFDHLGIEYKLFELKHKHTKLQTWLKKKYYGFNQIQDFDVPTCVLSGFYGDEYMLRSPSQTQMLIDDDLVRLFDETENSYMKLFFNQVYREKCSTIRQIPKKKLIEMIYNDIQVWHSNRTFVFTPYKDARLLRLLDCDQKFIIDQQIHCSLSKELIDFFNPNLLDSIGRQKNLIEPDWFDTRIFDK
jgi:hypothetical protein